MYTTNVEVVQNDFGYDLQFVVSDANGNTLDITGSSIDIFISKIGETNAKVVGQCVLTEPDQGRCVYKVEEGDFDVGGEVYSVELEIHWPNKVLTARGVTITVIPESSETR